MAKERRDNKNRILSKGEYQKPDGRYMYRYIGVDGEPRFVYSWTLTKTDRTPKGKQQGPCLRDLEKQIAKDLQDDINTHIANKKTLNDCFDAYIEQKAGIEPVTKSTYIKLYNGHVKDVLGKRPISEIKYSDVKRLYVNLLCKEKLSMGTIEDINIVLNPIFKIAVRDDNIRKNPTSGIIGELKKEYDYVRPKKKALTISEQESFIEFVKNSYQYENWLPLFTFLLGTGCRISEASALTWDDCDFKNGVIHITKSLVRCTDEDTGKTICYISPPKSAAGIRDIPMLSAVKTALQKERVRQMKEGFNKETLDGHTGFVFMDNRNGIVLGSNMNRLLKRIVAAHNEHSSKIAQKNNTSAFQLPSITTHIFRHTFCTRLCENETNLKVIQEIMGHSSIEVTMNVYNEATVDLKKSSFENLDGKFKIG